MISHDWITPDYGTLNLDAHSPVALSSKGVEGMGMPKTDSFTSQAPLLDGQTNTGWRAQPRECFWPIVIKPGPTDWEAWQTTFWKTMRPNYYGQWRVTKPDGSFRELTIRFSDDGDGVYETDPSTLGIEAHGITLIADDPWWKGPSVSKTFQTAQTPVPVFDTGSVVLNIMSANTVDSASIDNDGDVPAWPVFRFDGPITGFTMSPFAPPAIAIQGNIAVASGEYLLIETEPTRQLATLVHADLSTENVTDQLIVANFWAVPDGGTQSFYVQLNGPGSMTVTVTPKYRRAI